ncbi:MAG: hypothetical protein EOM06_11660 [Sphingobacteriia bacterium]|nr:hypothetical protein [Sphingobacteriia bacterium]
MKHLERIHCISIETIDWLGIKLGKLYRVNRCDSLKPMLTTIERALIYGRKPDITTRLMIELLGSSDLLETVFKEKEIKNRAINKYKKLTVQAFPQHDSTLTALFKVQKKLLGRKKAA